MDLSSQALTCYQCNKIICEFDFDETKITRKVFAARRDLYPFHVDYSHYSGKPVFIHRECRKLYYTTRFHGVLLDELADHCCSECKTRVSDEFYISRDHYPGRFIHRGCSPKRCGWCKIGGETPVVVPYLKNATVSPSKLRFHERCLTKFSSSKHKVLVDVDSFWPNSFNPITAPLYPPEFLLTAKTFLLVITRLNLKQIINRDIFNLIINFAVAPNLYPIQHGMDLSTLPLAKGTCRICRMTLALTRFDPNPCPNCCGILTERCPNGHTTWPYRSRDGCTVYRCASARCGLCHGRIRHDNDKQFDLCSITCCNFINDDFCFCGHDIYREISPEGLINVVPEGSCLLGGRCAYTIKGKFCSCGEAIYRDFKQSVRCCDGICREPLRIELLRTVEFK